MLIFLERPCRQDHTTGEGSTQAYDNAVAEALGKRGAVHLARVAADVA